MRHNKIENIDEELPPLESLVYLNLRTNKLAKEDDIPRLFTAFPTLVDLNVINCPIELNASSMNLMIGQMLVKNHSLKRFCKVEITDELRLQSVYFSKYKFNKEKEAAAAAAALAA
jgi:Leucine-rich repeat (LRR) protein